MNSKQLMLGAAFAIGVWGMLNNVDENLAQKYRPKTAASIASVCAATENSMITTTYDIGRLFQNCLDAKINVPGAKTSSTTGFGSHHIQGVVFTGKEWADLYFQNPQYCHDLQETVRAEDGKMMRFQGGDIMSHIESKFSTSRLDALMRRYSARAENVILSPADCTGRFVSTPYAVLIFDFGKLPATQGQDVDDINRRRSILVPVPSSVYDGVKGMFPKHYRP